MSTLPSSRGKRRPLPSACTPFIQKLRSEGSNYFALSSQRLVTQLSASCPISILFTLRRSILEPCHVNLKRRLVELIFGHIIAISTFKHTGSLLLYVLGKQYQAVCNLIRTQSGIVNDLPFGTIAPKHLISAGPLRLREKDHSRACSIEKPLVNCGSALQRTGVRLTQQGMVKFTCLEKTDKWLRCIGHGVLSSMKEAQDPFLMPLCALDALICMMRGFPHEVAPCWPFTSH